MNTSERGSTTVTVVILTPMFLVLLLFVVFVGRLAATEGDVRAAARDAARAASLRGTPSSAANDATTVARAALAGRNVSCDRVEIDTRTVTITTGAAVRVEVRCTLGVEDLTGFSLPGTRLLTAIATEPIDVYRGDRR